MAGDGTQQTATTSAPAAGGAPTTPGTESTKAAKLRDEANAALQRVAQQMRKSCFCPKSEQRRGMMVPQ